MGRAVGTAAIEGLTDANLRQPPPPPVMGTKGAASAANGDVEHEITDIVAPAATGKDVDWALRAPSINSVPATVGSGSENPTAAPKAKSSRLTKRAAASSPISSSGGLGQQGLAILNAHLKGAKSKRAWPDGLVVASAGKLRQSAAETAPK